MNVSDEMRDKLQAALDPVALEINDDSEKHRGHAGYQEGGQSHFSLVISSNAFADMSRIERHRAVHAALGSEILGRIHALSLDLQVPKPGSSASNSFSVS